MISFDVLRFSLIPLDLLWIGRAASLTFLLCVLLVPYRGRFAEAQNANRGSKSSLADQVFTWASEARLNTQKGHVMRSLQQQSRKQRSAENPHCGRSAEAKLCCSSRPCGHFASEQNKFFNSISCSSSRGSDSWSEKHPAEGLRKLFLLGG